MSRYADITAAVTALSTLSPEDRAVAVEAATEKKRRRRRKKAELAALKADGGAKRPKQKEEDEEEPAPAPAPKRKYKKRKQKRNRVARPADDLDEGEAPNLLDDEDEDE